MAKKPKRRKENSLWRDVRSWLGWVAMGVLLAAGVAAAWHWGSLQAEPAPGPTATTRATAEAIVFEEAPAPVQRPDRRQRVNEALLAALAEAGVPPGQTRMAVVAEPWGEICQIKVTPPGEFDVEALAAAVDRRLKPFAADAAWRRTATARVLELSDEGHITHRLILIREARKAQPGTGGRPKVAIVIDDIGYQLGMARQLLDLDLPLCFSVLPYSPHGRRIAEMARARGRQVLLHLPMEPRSYPNIDPGPGALFRNMTDEELVRQTDDDLAFVPQAVGVNNHMGSRFTEDPRALEPVLRRIGDKGLFFVDSATSPRSRAYDTAGRLSLRRGKRGIFLDHDYASDAVEHQIEALIHLARSNGGVIAIGHPHKSTLEVLRANTKRLKEEVELVPVSELVR